MHQLVNSVNIESTTNEFSNYYELLIENIGNFLTIACTPKPVEQP